jgi:hypothetical protein
MYIDLKDTKQKIVNRAGELKKNILNAKSGNLLELD